MNIFRFSRFFFKGLNRNFRLIRYGDVPDVYKLKVHMDRYAFYDGSVKGFLLGAKELGRHVFRPLIKVYKVPETPVVYCGPTKNNEREFEFFSSLVSREISLLDYKRYHNLSFVESVELRKTRSERGLSCLIFLFCLVYMTRLRACPITLKYLVVYSKVYLQVFSSFRRSGVCPQAVVVANDHTDFPVATSMVMQLFKIPVVYVQHAEVSESFPPLDFDVSILRNVRSLDIYKRVGDIVGDVFVLPRNEKATTFERIFEKPAQKVPVVVYLSSIFNAKEVERCVSLLQRNPNVNEVFLKPHPRGDLGYLRELEGVAVSESTPDFYHVAVVPNSSVVVELLEKGIPVFQYFGLDDINRDYYGFVNDQIAPEVVQSELSTQFWTTNFFDDNWKVRFAAFSPSVDAGWQRKLPGFFSRMSAILLDKVKGGDI
jgi:hypothetical protein